MQKYFDFFDCDINDINVNVYLITKISKGNYSSMILPNGIEQEVKETYKNNILNFLQGKEIIDYDYLYDKRTSVTKVSLNDVPVAKLMKDCLSNDVMFTKEDFNKKFVCIYIVFRKADKNIIKKLYCVAKYQKPETWYKKSVKFGFTGNVLEACNKDIFVLNGCVDSVGIDDEIVILNNTNVEGIFDFYDSAKELVAEHRQDIMDWSFLSQADKFCNRVTSGKTRTLALASALTKSQTKWEKVTPEQVYNILKDNDKFVDIGFDANHKIVCTDKNVDLILDILREVYSRQLFTNEVITTKGV